MDIEFDRRTALGALGAVGALATLPRIVEGQIPSPLPLPTPHSHFRAPGVRGRMTGAKAAVSALQCEGVACVYGIPGAQNNEFWDSMKTLGMPLPPGDP